MSGPHPCLLALPYLPLEEPVEFGGWWLGPFSQFEGEWQSDSFKRLSEIFLHAHLDDNERSVSNPAILVRSEKGADGGDPDFDEIIRIQYALDFTFINGFGRLLARPDPNTGHWLGTTDNTVIYAQPIDIDQGWLTLRKGGLWTPMMSGGHRLEEGLRIPPPSELTMPMKAVSLDVEVLAACYSTQVPSVPVALSWFSKVWKNAPSLRWEDRIVMVKTAFEAIAGTSSTPTARGRLRQLFENVLGSQSPLATKDLFWSPDETECLTDHKDEPVTQLEHWFQLFGNTRNEIIHRGTHPAPDYHEQANGADSPYNGNYLHTGERLLRETILVKLTEEGHEELWREKWHRGFERKFAEFQAQANSETETPDD